MSPSQTAILGYVEGQHVTFTYRLGAHQVDRLPALLAELICLAPDVIWTHSNAAAQAANLAIDRIVCRLTSAAT